MSMIICNECGKQISDQAQTCPNCGCPIASQQQQAITHKKAQKQNSTLSIWACILALFGCTAFVGFILGLVDLCKDDKSKKHTGSWFAVIIFIVYSIVGIIALSGSDSSDSSTTTTSTEKQNTIVEVGGNFDVDGLNITVNEATTNYTGYDNEYGFHDLPEGKKYIMVSFTCKNNSDNDKYVSIYDYECYADGQLCEQYYGFNDDSFMNTNLSSGRNVSFVNYYIVPTNATEIELEYTEFISFDDDKIIIKLQ